ncbi:hypothetical protein C5468_22345 [Photorhabdus luminescens subsp. mexicana]|uniref:Uncharacterized protein n=1 Tax=Photorhabdus luminescens subsp. mexicana TaxID=2100167 RepID=A0A4V2X4H3_PHOLU|nr:hypothetical protein C5468_22345 [Photorhabdus luminescens subsp. mexicana]
MDIPCIYFLSNGRPYILTESSVLESWLSYCQSGKEFFLLRGGKIVTATNVQRLNFIDLSSIPVNEPVEIDDQINF